MNKQVEQEEHKLKSTRGKNMYEQVYRARIFQNLPSLRQ